MLHQVCFEIDVRSEQSAFPQAVGHQEQRSGTMKAGAVKRMLTTAVMALGLAGFGLLNQQGAALAAHGPLVAGRGPLAAGHGPTAYGHGPLAFGRDPVATSRGRGTGRYPQSASPAY